MIVKIPLEVLEKRNRPENFNVNVFINCPFDEEYRPLFEAIIFTVFYLGFIPRSAMESKNGKETRIDKIKRIISECKFGVHDLSRIELSKGIYPRFNMPFELGLDMGCSEFGNDHLDSKSVLIMDRRKYRFRAFISDISGQDPAIHGGTVKGVVREIRNWLHTYVSQLPGVEAILRDYKRFRSQEAELRRILRKIIKGHLCMSII
ncbi:MAG TPA: hypothetical protein VFX22_05050 [Candidatus Kapabacteria bacterium]|nr:hypothetical protein [Candidatus Kapabacteria bacterium]